ncbi:Ig-like domain-containing protein, partial [Belliella sp. DSM 107340]
MKKNLLTYLIFIAFFAAFLPQKATGQITTIDFENPPSIGAIQSISIGGFTFASDLTNGFNIGFFNNLGEGGTWGLGDNNIPVGGLKEWKISKNDEAEFQFRSVYIKDRGFGAINYGEIQGFKNGIAVGAKKSIQFDGVKDFVADPDFYEVDEIVISGQDINVILDNFTFGTVFEDGVNIPTEVSSIILNAAPLSNVSSVTFSVNFSKPAFNVSVDDFQLTRIGSANGTIASVTGSGTAYTVTVNNITGDGSLRLDLRSGTNISNVNGNTGTPAFTSGQSHFVSPCLIETFEDETIGSKIFTTGTNSFTITGDLEVYRGSPLNVGIGGSRNVLKNTGSGTYTISSVDDKLIFLNTIGFYLSSFADGNAPTGSGILTLRGLRNGDAVFSNEKNSGFETGTTNNGYTIVDFATEGGTGLSTIGIDQLEIEIGGGFVYLNIDNFGFCSDTEAPSGYSVSIDQDPINLNNQNNVNFTFANAEIGTRYNYTFSSSGGGTNVTGSGNVTSIDQTITGINLSGLAEGTITLNVTLTDIPGNVGDVESDTVTKSLNPILDGGRRIDYRENDPPISFSSGGTLLVLTNGVNINQAAITFLDKIDGDVLAVGDTGPYAVSTDGDVITFSGTGTAAQMSAALNSITYVHNGADPDRAGSDQTRAVEIFVVDASGRFSPTIRIDIGIESINDAPTMVSLPSEVTVTENAASTLDLSAATFSDIDAGTFPISLTLQVNTGILQAISGSGVVIGGSGTTSMTLTGSQFAIDEYLNTPSNIQYTGAVGIRGNNAALLTVFANDGGNTGTGGGTSVELGTVNIDIVEANNVPTVDNPIEDQEAIQDVLFDFAFAANTFEDVDGDDLIYSAQLSGGGVLPAWLTFDGENRRFSGTPSNSDVGILSVELVADDENGGVVSTTFDIVVANVNDEPTLANPIVDQNAIENQLFTFRFADNTFNDIDVGDVLTYSAQLTGGDPLPTWLTFDGSEQTFSGTPGNNDVETLSIEVIASDGEYTISASFDLTIQGVNDAPVIFAPFSISIFEDEPEGLTGISFTDIDAGSADVLVTLEVNSGTLAARSGDGVIVGGNSTSLTLTGSVDDINSFLANEELTFTTSLNSTENVTLSIVIDDQGNTGSGGAQSDNATVSLVVTAVNDAPVNTVPGTQSVAQNETLTFSADNGNQISVSDVDLGSNSIEITINASNGLISLANTNGLIFTQGSGTNDGIMNFTGTLVNVNNALDGMIFTPFSGLSGTGSLGITSNDQGFSGSGGAQSDTDVISITINPINPVVTSVSSSTANGSYKVGDQILIQVIFDQPVDVNTAEGLPTLILETGGVDRASSYVDGSGSTILNFIYTIQLGDFSADLDYLGIYAFNLNGAIIENGNNISAELALPAPGTANSLSGQKNIVVDGIVPVVSSVSVPPNGIYSLGQNLDFLVNFSEAVIVNGSPQFSLIVGSTSRQANYSSGSGTSALFFSYIVQSGDLDLNGIVAQTLSLNSGTLRDAAGNDANLALNGIGSTSQVLVDGVQPTVVSLNLNNTSLTIGQTSTLTVVFSERISSLETADFSVQNGNLSSLSSSDGGLTWTATLTPNSGIEAGTNIITLDNLGYTDLAGNSGTGTTDSNNFAVDTQRPTATVTVSDTQLIVGETTLVTVVFSEAISELNLEDFSVANGSLSALSSLDGGITWTAILTPELNVKVPNNIIQLDNTGYQDLAGNSGLGTTNSNSYSVDTVNPFGYSVSIIPELVNSVNQNDFSFNLLDGEIGATYSFTITSSAGGNVVLGNGTISSSNQQIGGIDVSGLPDGELTLTVTLINGSGNEGAPVNDTTEKRLPSELTIRVVQNADENGVNGLFEIVTDNIFGAITMLELEIGGTATPGEDYTPIPIGILFPGNTTSVLIPIEVIDDLDVEGDETVTIRLVRTDNSLVTIGEPSQATLTIADNDVPRQLTITPDVNQQKVYGDNDPTSFSYTASGFDSGDDETIIQGSLTRQVGEDVGTYSYTLGNLHAGSNYELIFNPGVFTITPATLSIEVDDLEKLYGAEEADYSYTASGFRRDDSAAILEGTIGRSGGEDVGTYQFNLGTLSAGANYNLLLISNPLRITPAPLTITADDKQKTFSQANPTLTFSYAGLVNGDTQVADEPIIATTATEASPVGNYQITLSGGSDPNYSISIFNGTLIVNPADISGIGFDDASFVFDGTGKSLEITGTLPAGTSVAYADNSRTNVGTQQATATITGSNFQTLVLTADLEITAAEITGITFDDASFVFDGSEKSIEITGTLPAGTSVSYADNSRTNVGTQEAIATITGSNFQTLVLTADLEITAAEITGITFDDASFVFDGSEKS